MNLDMDMAEDGCQVFRLSEDILNILRRRGFVIKVNKMKDRLHAFKEIDGVLQQIALLISFDGFFRSTDIIEFDRILEMNRS